MGGLLSLNASLNPNFKVKGVLLISSPLKLRYSLYTLRLGIRLTLFQKSTDELLETYRKSSSISRSPTFTYGLWLKQVMDLHKLMAKTKSNLPDVVAPTTIILSKKDETVSRKTAEIFYGGLKQGNKKLVILEESRHAFYVPKEKAIICQELLHLINSPSVLYCNDTSKTV